MAKIYLSYSEEDAAIAADIKASLSSKKHIIMDFAMIKAGQNRLQELSDAQKKADGTIVIFTKNSLNNEYVTKEIGTARGFYERADKKKFFIALYDSGLAGTNPIRDIPGYDIGEGLNRPLMDKLDQDVKKFIAGNRKAAAGQASIFNQQSARSLWMLKINDKTWPIDSFGVDPNREYHFNSYYNSGTTGDDYLLFKKVRTGDAILGYGYFEAKAILCVFEVVRDLHSDPSLGEILKMTVSFVFNPALSLASIAAFLPFEQQLSSDVTTKLFEVPRESILRLSTISEISIEQRKIFSDVLDAAPGNENIGQRNKNAPDAGSLFGIFSDGIATKIVDRLGFDDDIDALAPVIAYSDLNPPIAIGLFGNWGSGKSFFINKLADKIENLAGTNNAYCNDIVSIHFNSWHYSDANLWASLITRIFTKLEEHGAKQPEGQLKALFRNLHTAKELLLDTQARKSQLEADITAIKERATAVESDIRQRSMDLSDLQGKDILKLVLEDNSIKSTIKEFNKEFNFLKIKEFDEIDKNLDTLKSDHHRIVNFSQLLYSFRKGRLLLVLGVALFFWLVLQYLMSHSAEIKETLENLKWWIVAAAGLLTQFINYLVPARKAIQKIYVRLQSLKKTVEQKQRSEQQKYNAEREAIKIQLSVAETSRNELQTQIEQLTSQALSLQGEISDIETGKKLVKFIEARVADEKYTGSLGIISWIRKDFEQLDFLLKQQHDARVSAADKVDNIFKIDRIILYIDDLDRCNETVVVRVLEAIHLLLAFPLFVVVVGVDPRWVHNALSVKYENLFCAGNNEDLLPITSYDYLEKIFQIPFALKPIDEAGMEKLIRSLMKNELEVMENNADSQSQKSNINLETKPITTVPVDSAQVNIAGQVASQIEQPATISTPAKNREDKTILKLLNINDREINLMQSIGFLIGESPRTVKRYVNTYRIIRIHTGFKFGEGDIFDYYYAGMVLLAIITGTPNAAVIFFNKLDTTENGTMMFKTFLASFLKTEQLAKEEKRILDLLQSNVLKKNAALGNLSVAIFKLNMPLIARFSFRSILVA